MLSLCARCLAVLLTLALVSGNASAALHLRSAHSEPCSEEHGASGKTSHHHHNPAAGIKCCCDCLACASAGNLIPELALSPIDLSIVLRYDLGGVFLTGRAPLPEPDPPRPVSLI